MAAVRNVVKLCEGEATGGAKAAVTIADDRNEVRRVGFLWWGTIGSGTCAIEGSPDNGVTWIQLYNFAAGAAFQYVEFGGCNMLRANITAGTGSDFNLFANGINAVIV